ncbi:hypothetical protein ACFVXH_39935 [Kitasatospora sp. NPDC058184]|uniref:hypothetical protein n=1 Tax=Kitasatospora sp. NPDC058184 TaxID=3346370 RepID=UPI0036DEC7CE
MTAKFSAGLELPRILPGDPAWIRRAAYLSEVFGLVARAADVRPHAYPLPALTLEVASEAVGDIDVALTAAAAADVPPRVVLYTLPAWVLKALQDVLTALRAAAVEGPADDSRLRGTLVLLGEDLDYPRCRTPAEMAADLELVVAVLELDGPAVRAAATDLALGRLRADSGAALTEVFAQWVVLGVPL